MPYYCPLEGCPGEHPGKYGICGGQLSNKRVGALIFFWCLMLAGLFAMTAVMCYGEHVAESVKRQVECATIVGEKPKCTSH